MFAGTLCLLLHPHVYAYRVSQSFTHSLHNIHIRYIRIYMNGIVRLQVARFTGVNDEQQQQKKRIKRKRKQHVASYI